MENKNPKSQITSFLGWLEGVVDVGVASARHLLDRHRHPDRRVPKQKDRSQENADGGQEPEEELRERVAPPCGVVVPEKQCVITILSIRDSDRGRGSRVG